MDPKQRRLNDGLTQALRILTRRDYFRRELAERLKKRDFSPEEIDWVIGRCEEMGYLDDARLARRFAELRAPVKGWGPTRIRMELTARGVDESTAERASHLDRIVFESALETAVRRAVIRARPGWWRTGEGRSRMISSLIRRGFDPSEARREVGRQCASREAADHATNDQPGDPDGIS